MKYYLFVFLLLISVFGFSQSSRIDFKGMEKNLKNPQSPYHYDRLIFKYRGIPKSLDSLEAQYLYYGRNFEANKVLTSEKDFQNLAEAFKKNDIEECIKIGKRLYGKDPTNLDVLLILLRAYDEKKDMNNFAHHVTQLRMLTGAIKNSGDGQSEKTAYYVNSVGDEYIFLNILNLGQGYTKATKTVKEGVMDIWEKEGRKIYIKVLYLDL